MSITMSVSELIGISFDRFYNTLDLADVEVPLDLKEHLSELEANCIVEAESEYTTEMEDIRQESYDQGYEVGGEESYDRGYEDGKEVGLEDGYEDGYDAGWQAKVDESDRDCVCEKENCKCECQK
jgi:flagellar biosynthesis/type III secretory pathway protein FliH